MLCMGKATTQPVPKAFALNSDNENNYIITEYIMAETLTSKWRSLSVSQKGTVTMKPKLLFIELRQLPSPVFLRSRGECLLLDEISHTRDK